MTSLIEGAAELVVNNVGMCFVSEFPSEAFDLLWLCGYFCPGVSSCAVVADEPLESCIHVILLPSTVLDGIAFIS